MAITSLKPLSLCLSFLTLTFSLSVLRVFIDISNYKLQWVSKGAYYKYLYF